MPYHDTYKGRLKSRPPGGTTVDDILPQEKDLEKIRTIAVVMEKKLWKKSISLGRGTE